jgi:nucleotide-binding universal stress UspA family protein
MLHAGCPTICIPETGATDAPKSIVIGWNESGEALRAVRAALPLIQAAGEVHITVVDPPNHGPDRSDPGGALAVMLSRYGVHADIQVMPKTGGRVGDTILRHVSELNADMIVMGGYGHSRFREAILGGATRHMLEYSKVPVLLAH